MPGALGSSEMMPLACSSKPAVCCISSRMVTGLPSRAGTLKSMYWLTSASRSILPCSTCCMTAVQVRSFDTEPGRNSVSFGSTGARFSTSAKPKPRSVRIWPSLTTATTQPAMSPVLSAYGR